MSESVLLVEKRERIAILTLNRPKVMNALSRSLRVALKEAFENLADDPKVRVVILTGAGRAFCSGIDLKDISALGAGDEKSKFLFAGDDFMTKMNAFDRPIIGAINGAAITGGFELALACDILIASSKAYFADTHARVGLVPAWGVSQKLPRIIGIGRAKELSFTGNRLPAEKAEAWGLVNRVVEPENLLPACLALVADILASMDEVVKSYKRTIDDGFATTLSQGLKIETEAAAAFFLKAYQKPDDQNLQGDQK